MLKILFLIFLIGFVIYKSTNNLNFDIVEIEDWGYSVEEKRYNVTFKWKGQSLPGFIIDGKSPSMEKKYVVAGYDANKRMWHLVEKK